VTPIRKTRWAWTLATFFGAGHLRPGPGTYGSIAALLLWYAACHMHPLNALPRAFFTLLATLLITAIGIPAATIVSREANRKDPGFIVIDEVAGQLLVLIAARPQWPSVLLALLLFRLFDIAKPWPIRLLEKLPNGVGIVVDDLGAGVYAFIAYCFLSVPYSRLLSYLHWLRP
jgi:phosphatidylglycerophosphatase A